MWKQLINLARLVGSDARQRIFQLGIRNLHVQLDELDQARDGRSPFPGAQRAGEQPVRAAQGDGPDLSVNQTVVDW